MYKRKHPSLGRQQRQMFVNLHETIRKALTQMRHIQELYSEKSGDSSVKNREFGYGFSVHCLIV